MKTQNRFFAFGLVLVALASCGPKKGGLSRKGDGEKAVPVTVSKAVEAQVARRIRVRCALRSRWRTLVSPKVPGVLEEVLVDAGDRVQKGETVLFRTDSRIPRDAVEAARAGLKVALKGLDQARAALDAASAAEEKARLDRDRFARLLQGGGAVTKDALEKAQVAWKAAAARLREARAAVDLARARADQARTQEAIAQKRLQDCTVKAPMDGVVTRKFMEKGEMGDVGRPVFAMEDPEHLEAAGFLEASLFHRVKPGKTLVRILEGDEEIFRGPLSWKSPTVRPELRVFEVRLYLPEGFSRAAPGELLTMEVVLDPHKALTVPTGAVVILKSKAHVFRVEEGKAGLVEVKTGVVDGERTEVLGNALKAGDRVVVRGQAFLTDGRAVKVRSAGKGE